MDVFKFAEQFDKLSLDNKMQTQKRLQSTLTTGLILFTLAYFAMHPNL